MVTCIEIPVTISSDGSLPNSTLHAIVSAVFPLEWPRASPESLIVTRHTGYANTNCVVERPPPAATEPLKVFVKINGALDGEIAIFKHLVPTKPEEAQLCSDFGRGGRGARLHGFFRTACGAYGRVDEFVDARALTPRDVEDSAIREELAAAYAALHALRTEREKKPVREYYDALTRELARHRGSAALKKAGGGVVDDVVDYDFAGRIGRVAAALERMGAKTGWCVHDVQYGNTLLRTEPLPPGQQHRVVLIDFEFVFNDYRGVDIGGHFLHKLIQWFGDENSKLTHARPYSAEEKADFCRAYAEQWEKETGDGEDGDKVLREAEMGYVLAVAFEVHNMYSFLEEEGEEDEAEMEALRMLFGEFERVYATLGLDDE